MNTAPIPDRLAALDTLTLDHGSHGSFTAGHCALEVTAWLAGERHTDRPTCVDPVIAAFVRTWNDSIPDGARRTELLRPLLPLMVGTAAGDHLRDRRAFLAADWAVRTFTPAWLRLATLDGHAKALTDLAPLDSAPSCKAAMPTIATAWDAANAAAWDAANAAARDAAWAADRIAAGDAGAAAEAAAAAAWAAAGAAAGDAGDAGAAAEAAWAAAGDAAGDAAWAAARAAARAAAWAAARAAARDAAWAAARAKARAAARDAAWAALEPTVVELQASAQDLVRRMCALTGGDAA